MIEDRLCGGQTHTVTVDIHLLRDSLGSGSARLEATPLLPEEIELIAWSGSRTHLENVLTQLERVTTGEVEYLTLRAEGVPVAKGGSDFAKEVGAAAIWQLATHPQLQGLGLATRLIGELESRAVRRGVRRLRIGVGVENVRARRLYEHLGYEVVGESEASCWQRLRTALGSFTGRHASRC